MGLLISIVLLAGSIAADGTQEVVRRRPLAKHDAPLNATERRAASANQTPYRTIGVAGSLLSITTEASNSGLTEPR